MDATRETLAIVTDTFMITGRGLVGALDRALPTGITSHVHVTIRRPDGTELEAEGYVEFILRRTIPVDESAALYFPRLAKEALPVGSRIIALDNIPASRAASDI